jgi:hypothetical protein
MSRKSSPENRDDLETRIKKLVSFEKGEGTSGPSQEPSKYARVLTCTFVRGAENPTHRRKKQPKIICFPDLTAKEEASIK